MAHNGWFFSLNNFLHHSFISSTRHFFPSLLWKFSYFAPAPSKRIWSIRIYTSWKFSAYKRGLWRQMVGGLEGDWKKYGKLPLANDEVSVDEWRATSCEDYWMDLSSLMVSDVFAGFPAAAYAAYAAGRGYSGYPSFGLPYPTGNLSLATLHHYYSNNHNINHHPLHPLLSSCHPFVHHHHSFDPLGILAHTNSLHLWTAACSRGN